MFILAFFQTKAQDGVMYDTIRQMIHNASSVLRMSEHAVAAWLLDHPAYVYKLVPSMTLQ